GKISALMGDMAKGIKSFKKGMAEDDSGVSQTNTIDATAETTVPVDAKDKETA
ncbi:MAG: twin-arginine translocase TatA/TatE family subunit, partial [Alphaproteobacteria bacterium]|nr:twin-arginine translocase TatA/TatE family subunit [Alphaproteobacteria bacterium]